MIATFAYASTISAPTISESEGQVTDILQTTSYQPSNTSSNKLKNFLAQQLAKYGDPDDYFTLYNLIQCESGWDIDAQNPKSTAHGLSQFLRGTFDGYCGGDFYNPYSQIHCLVIAWTDNKQHWWDESKWCWEKYLTN